MDINREGDINGRGDVNIGEHNNEEWSLIGVRMLTAVGTVIGEGTCKGQ